MCVGVATRTRVAINHIIQGDNLSADHVKWVDVFQRMNMAQLTILNGFIMISHDMKLVFGVFFPVKGAKTEA